jgi:hypothetical protein
VFTVGYRKVRDGMTMISAGGRLTWDLRDGKGRRVADGVYYVRLRALGNEVLSRVVVLR